jgi:hypothetical protein
MNLMVLKFGISQVRLTVESLFRSSRYWAKTGIVSGPCISLIQVLSVITEARVLCRLCFGTASKKSWVTSAMQRPSSQVSTQNWIQFPSPTTMFTNASKNANVCGSSLKGMEANEQVGSTRCSHSHQRRKAIPISFRSRWTRRQATRHCPPRASSELIKRKPVIIFLNALCSQRAGKGKWACKWV